VQAALDAQQQATDLARQRMADLQRLSAEVGVRQQQLLQITLDLDAMDTDLAKTVEEYNLNVMQLEDARRRAVSLQQQLGLTGDELSTVSQSFSARVVGAYKSRSSTLEVLLNTTDLVDLVKRLQLIFTVARSDRDRLDEIGSLRARSSALLDDLSRQIYDVTEAAKRLTEQKKLIQGKVDAQQAYLNQLTEEIRTLVGRQTNVSVGVVPPGVDLTAFLHGDGNVIVQAALRYLGIPYVWGGASPAGGFDCSGLTQYVFGLYGVYIPHFAAYQQVMGIEVPLSAAQPGDLVFFGNPAYHVAIYMGNGMIVEAPRTGDVVRITPLSQKSNLSNIRRLVLPLSPKATTTQPAALTP
jgi:cell wall-associated NlpC family hydrolase